MICPKCKKEMCIGMLGPGGKGSLFWAEDDYFKNKTDNLFTEKNAIKRGAIHIPVGNGITNKRTRAWACNECKLVLIDCN